MNFVRRRFGQHFLKEPVWIDRIHSVLSISERDSVLEVGPGTGALTVGLLEATRDVVAVEIDKDLVVTLRSRFPKLQVIERDVLDMPDTAFDGRRIVGNLPYNISTPLMLRLSEHSGLEDMHFMFQREVVDRLTASPGTKDWSRLSVKIQRLWVVSRKFDVEPDAFQPAPDVVSSFAKITRRENPTEISDEILFDDVLRAAFSQRRKKLSNSLAEFNVDWDGAGVDCELRADQISTEKYVAIVNSVIRPDPQ